MSPYITNNRLALAILDYATQIGSFLCRTAQGSRGRQGWGYLLSIGNIFATKLCQCKPTLQGWSDKCKMQRHNDNTYKEFTYNDFTYN